MSIYEEYDPRKLIVERATHGFAKVGTFIVGSSHLGTTGSEIGDAWETVDFATLTFSSSYQPNEDRVLIVDSESATLSMSYYGDEIDNSQRLRTSDRIRVRYNGTSRWSWEGVVETVNSSIYFDYEARARGEDARTDFTAILINSWYAAMRKQVCWIEPLPAESAITRVRRWVSVSGW